MRSLNTIRDFYRFRYVNGIPCRVSPSHPININCHSRLRYPIDQTQIQQLLLSSFTLFPNHSFSNLHLLFFLHLHDVWRHLGGLPIWEQPCTRLPWRGPSRVSVHWTFGGLSGETDSTDLPNRFDRISWRCCKEPSMRCTWHARVTVCFSVNKIFKLIFWEKNV